MRDNPFDEVLKLAHEFKKIRNFEQAHAEYDFFLKMMAHPDAPHFINLYEMHTVKRTILGVPLIIHESAEKPFWFEPSETVTKHKDFPK